MNLILAFLAFKFRLAAAVYLRSTLYPILAGRPKLKARNADHTGPMDGEVHKALVFGSWPVKAQRAHCMCSIELTTLYLCRLTWPTVGALLELCSPLVGAILHVRAVGQKGASILSLREVCVSCCLVDVWPYQASLRL